jgi:predicted nucleic acid-binding protein
MYLLDTNIWLERLLDQGRSGEVEKFLSSVPSERLFITDFSLHSIGVILGRLGCISAFCSFIEDLFIDGSVTVVALDPAQMRRLARAMELYRLDFDDAYQYTAAFEHNLALVSFDSDFERTPGGRLTPAEVEPEEPLH